jgi:hypothetical protein
MGLKRTLVVVGGIAVAAAVVAGGGVAWWRSLPRGSPRASAGAEMCESDWDCPGPFSCKEMKVAGEDGVRMGKLCRVRGIAREGDPCRALTHDFHEACIEGLRCNYGVCGRSCDPAAPDACPAGTRCRGWFEPPSCVPSCRGPADCAGAECAWVDADFAICASARGERCDVHPCRPGMVCRSLFLPFPQNQVVETQCVVPCSKESPCPSGQLCDERECAIPCRAGSQDCSPSMVCAPAVGQRRKWRCWPEGHPLPTFEQQRSPPKLPSLPIERPNGRRTWLDGQGQ